MRRLGFEKAIAAEDPNGKATSRLCQLCVSSPHVMGCWQDSARLGRRQAVDAGWPPLGRHASQKPYGGNGESRLSSSQRW
jgi:hypothetical protein